MKDSMKISKKILKWLIGLPAALCVGIFVLLWMNFGSFNHAVGFASFLLQIPHPRLYSEKFQIADSNPIVDSEFEASLRCVYGFYLTLTNLSKLDANTTIPDVPVKRRLPVRLEIYTISDGRDPTLLKSMEDIIESHRGVGGVAGYTVHAMWLDPGKYEVRLYVLDQLSDLQQLNVKFGVGYSLFNKMYACDYLSHLSF